MESVERYRFFQCCFTTDEEIVGYFWQEDGGRKQIVYGFLKEKGEMALRFMPKTCGVWNYEIFRKNAGFGKDAKFGKGAEFGDEAECGDAVRLDSNARLAQGSFLCKEALENNHGMVKADGQAFRYEDGTRFLPFGTTCYAWIHQPQEVREQTLESLGKSPFNKVRMLIFPKDMIYNCNEPEFFPFEKDGEGWDVNKPVPAFWENLENCIAELDKLGAEADLILFHPYDRWGFADLLKEQSITYVNYIINRLGAYKNIWWSLANEYDLVGSKEQEDWEEIAEILVKEDPYGHLRSIHHCINMYPKRDWMTHCSVQTKQAEKALAYRLSYGIPVMMDECGYEGNIEFTWGNLSAKEMVHRIWLAVARGGYATHGETFFREDELLWWAKGGQLYGESPARIAFLKDILESLEGTLHPETGFASADPNGREEAAESPFAKAMMKLPEAQRNEEILNLFPYVIYNGRHRLQYLGKACQAWLDIPLPEGDYRVEVIDSWEMTRTVVMEKAHGSIRVELPGKEGMAVLATKI